MDSTRLEMNPLWGASETTVMKLGVYLKPGNLFTNGATIILLRMTLLRGVRY
jgi:hypothetical protein